MKRSKLMTAMLMALMFFPEISLKAQQSSFTVGSFSYQVINAGSKEVELKGYASADDVLTLDVPETVTYNNQEFTVTIIGDFAFAGCENFTKVNLPEGIISIGDNTFDGCNSLREIILSSSVTSIGTSAFKGCTNLKKVNIPEGVTSIGDYTFGQCYFVYICTFFKNIITDTCYIARYINF